MKVIIAGTRTFTDYALLSRKCDAILADQSDVQIISGKCPGKDGKPGADKLGERYAAERRYNLIEMPADWSRGLSGGPIRNRAMAAQADALIAFWDGVSPGTKNMVDEAHAAGLLIRVIIINNQP